MDPKIKVSGNIITELSEKIPSNIVALNELIKNAYDAGARNVSIIIDTPSKTLSIVDDGSGMTLDDLNTLFHISNSTKAYGKINEYDRITQGSKGLGFLAVFKFGQIVEWNTNSNVGLKFQLDHQKFKDLEDITDFNIEIIQDDSIAKGTSIKINLNDYSLTSLKKHLLNEKNYKKLLKSFDDEDFSIYLQIDGIEYLSSQIIPLKENAVEYQLYYVTYDSNEQMIKYEYNNQKILTKKFPFLSDTYDLKIELLIFQLQPYGKRKIDTLFWGPNDDLTPLLYINTNLIDNYEMFDPSIMRTIKTSSVLNQMIGYVRITSDNPQLDFNPDRTQFLQNQFSDSVKDFLYQINKTIQEFGADHKNYLMNFDILTVSALPSEFRNIKDVETYRKYIKNNFAFKAEVQIVVTDDSIKYSLFGKEATIIIEEPRNTDTEKQETSTQGKASDSEPSDTNTTPSSGKNSGNEGEKTDAEAANSTEDSENKPESDPSKKSVPASINLNTTSDFDRDIPTQQIDLTTFIASVYDSSGKSVDEKELSIRVNGQPSVTGILESITTPCKKTIEYAYNDIVTGRVVAVVNINFVSPYSNITTQKPQNGLIKVPSYQNYKIAYNLNVCNLIEQINSLELADYQEVISCSLRAILELSVNEIRSSSKFPSFFRNANFEEQVVQVVEYIASSKPFLSAIANNTSIEYSTLQNILDSERFRSGVSKAHLGAHKAGTFIRDLEELGILIGVFVLVVNEMLTNNSIV